MYNHHLWHMANNLVKDGLLPQPRVYEAMDSMNRYWHDKIAVVWSANDIRAVAAQYDVAVSGDEIDMVLDMLLEKHDATQGINWEQIYITIQNVQFEVGNG